MDSHLLVILLALLLGFSFGDRTVSSYNTQENPSHPKFELKIFTSELFKLDIKDSYGISEQCSYDFNLYKEAILNHTTDTNDGILRTLIDNVWAYKSKSIEINVLFYQTSFLNFNINRLYHLSNIKFDVFISSVGRYW